ncbi:MAG: 2-C-methyl-D-erythritol 4-phosphate cytidylyltransferase [Phycisphaerae bacterium]|nr:2-C-methyl-D-erythritol 4-phosphate cytidylyltransferase [Phycisphaerae bacterium]
MAKIGVIVSTLAGPGQSQCFAKVKGREVFMRSLELFIARDDVCATVLAVAEDKAEQIKKKYGPHLAFASVKVVAGKDHFAGVAAALEEIGDDAELIAIHDAARPAISAMQIDALIETAAKSGAAMLAAPLRQNIRKVDKDKKISAILDSAELWFAQTPQVFKAQILRDAYAKRAEFAAGCADDADLVAAAGTAATVLPSSWRNIRVATSDDITVAAPIIDAVPKPKPKGPTGPYAEDKMW